MSVVINLLLVRAVPATDPALPPALNVDLSLMTGLHCRDGPGVGKTTLVRDPEDPELQGHTDRGFGKHRPGAKTIPAARSPSTIAADTSTLIPVAHPADSHSRKPAGIPHGIAPSDFIH